MTDSLTSPTSGKNLGVIDAILEVFNEIVMCLFDVSLHALRFFFAHFPGIFHV